MAPNLIKRSLLKPSSESSVMSAPQSPLSKGDYNIKSSPRHLPCGQPNNCDTKCYDNDCFNVLLGQLYADERVSSALISKIAGQFVDENEPSTLTIAALIEFILLHINTAANNLLAEFFLCIKNSFRDNSSFYQSILAFTKGYIEQLTIFSRNNNSCCNNYSSSSSNNLYGYLNLVFLVISSLNGLINLLLDLINGMCDGHEKQSFLNCFLEKIAELLQPILSIIFPCGATKPCPFTCPSSNNCNRAYPQGGYQPPCNTCNQPNYTLQQTVNYGPSQAPNGKGLFQNIFNALTSALTSNGNNGKLNLGGILGKIGVNQEQLGSISSLLGGFDLGAIGVLVISLLNSYLRGNSQILDSLKNILGKNENTSKLLNILTNVSSAPEAIFKTIKESFDGVNASSIGKSCSDAFQSLVSNFGDYGDLTTILLVVGILALPILCSQCVLCYNLYWFVYLSIRLISDQLYFLQCFVDTSLYCDSCVSGYDKTEFNAAIFNLLNYHIKNAKAILLPTLASFITCAPRPPRYFVKNLRDRYLPFLALFKDKCSPCYLIVSNIVSELDCMLDKLYNCNNQQQCALIPNPYYPPQPCPPCPQLALNLSHLLLVPNPALLLNLVPNPVLLNLVPNPVLLNLVPNPVLLNLVHNPALLNLVHNPTLLNLVLYNKDQTNI